MEVKESEREGRTEVTGVPFVVDLPDELSTVPGWSATKLRAGSSAKLQVSDTVLGLQPDKRVGCAT